MEVIILLHKFSQLRQLENTNVKACAARHHHAELGKLSMLVICVPSGITTHCKTCWIFIYIAVLV